MGDLDALLKELRDSLYSPGDCLQFQCARSFVPSCETAVGSDDENVILCSDVAVSDSCSSFHDEVCFSNGEKLKQLREPGDADLDALADSVYAIGCIFSNLFEIGNMDAAGFEEFQFQEQLREYEIAFRGKPFEFTDENRDIYIKFG